jgi:assimilatory nitrate reductase electron transfer subunit
MDDDEMVCQCNGVNKGAICAAIRSGCETAAAVSTATRAATGCGTCRFQVEGLLAAVPEPV